jgi:5-oxoprolinase (ATP-hydrolysing)
LGSAPEAVRLEIFNNLLAGVAERMGHALRRTAMSVNVKERLDYSCAVFDAAGQLAASAAHIPVHLGAMGATVRAIIADNPAMRPGDAYATNDPYRGGSHLPDVTVVLPVYVERRLAFFTACRAHHAELGGSRPGSMPPWARRLGEEGVVISNVLLVRDGRIHEVELRRLLTEGPYPSRAVEENLADLRAQLAAVQRGAEELRDLVARHTWPVVDRLMQEVQDAAETKVRRALARLPAGERSFVDCLELPDGSTTPVAVRIALSDDPSQPAATMDFTGTGPVVDGNLNANAAITSAAALYVLRLLVDEDIPLNEGALRAVRIVMPPCLLNPAAATPLADSPAVAAGNVETSQRVVDVLLGALGLAAASQGTMNNVLFGDEKFGFYETVCGGSGATAHADGASAVQVHMTNTRSTDPEVLERRLPVRLWEFSVRRGSGGAGARRGGDGAVRRIEFLAPLALSLVTQRRGPHRPFGLNGGEPGAAGENLLFRAGGATEQLPAIAERAVGPGDVLELRTPGGGGFGPPVA